MRKRRLSPQLAASPLLRQQGPAPLRGRRRAGGKAPSGALPMPMRGLPMPMRGNGRRARLNAEGAPLGRAAATLGTLWPTARRLARGGGGRIP